VTANASTGASAAPTSFFEFRVAGIVGEPDLLGPLRGRVVLAVNVASRCGYTPQYTELQRLHEENAQYGLTVVGFPCNQFGAQEPGTDAEIRDFCSTRYDVTFPLAARLEVNGPGRHPLYAWLCAGHGPAIPAGDIHWNFEKFLIDRTGRVRARFPSGTRPLDAGLIGEVADLVAEEAGGEGAGGRG
jgi:glutathione peroxidase